MATMYELHLGSLEPNDLPLNPKPGTLIAVRRENVTRGSVTSVRDNCVDLVFFDGRSWCMVNMTPLTTKIVR